MRFSVPALILLCLPAVALAGKPATAERSASARLVECDTDGRAAAFRGTMRAFAKSQGLSMRFELQIRDSAHPVWSRVAAAEFERPTTAAAGVKRYVFDRRVANLAPGADYRAQIRFRWRDAGGATVARAVKRTKACAQPDTRANLKPTRISVSSGSTDETRFYAVRVLNAGRGEAPPFSTRIDVAGTVPPEEAIGEPLPAGGEEVFEFEAPACAAGTKITATVDTRADVDEVDEMDNVLAIPCPSR